MTNQVRIRRDIAAMEAYTPTASLEVFAERLGFAVQDLVKLDANENPFGPSPNALAALHALHETAPIYPDPEYARLREKLGDYIDVDPAHILVGAGADELITLINLLFIEPGDAIINCPPTFGMYGFDAPIYHAREIAVPRKEDFSLDMEGIIRAAEQENVKLLYLCSPNNPSGNLIDIETIQRLLQLPLTVVLDEAYIEFSNTQSMAGYVPQTPNLIVLRTFSKWAGLAGLRLGYGVFPLELMTHLWKIKQPYNVSVAADAMGRASLDDRDALLERVRLITQERQRLEKALMQIPYLHVYPSRANFILCRVQEGMDAALLRDNLAKREGIIIRYYRKPGLQDCIRVSAGTPEQNDRLIAALQNYGG